MSAVTITYTGSNNTQAQTFDNGKGNQTDGSRINDAAQNALMQKQLADSRQGDDCHPCCIPCYLVVGILKVIQLLFKCLFPCLKCWEATSDTRGEGMQRTTKGDLYTPNNYPASLDRN